MLKSFAKLTALLLTAVLLFSVAPAGIAADLAADITLDRFGFDLVEGGESEFGLVPLTAVDSKGNVTRVGASLVADSTGSSGNAEQDDLPAKYDLRDFERVTSVKNQLDSGSCWAFSAIGAIESELITEGYGAANGTDLSEAHLVWFSQRSRATAFSDPTYGDGRNDASPYETGGNWLYVTATLAKGTGPVFESTAPFTANVAEMGHYAESRRYESVTTLENAELFGAYSDVKRAVIDKGAVGVSFYSDWDYYNSDNKCYYQDFSTSSNHSVLIVGWDDNYPRSNFNRLCRPAYDGAFLCRNSWGVGSSYTNNGYFWISYQDNSLNSAVYFDVTRDCEYDTRYQYDGFAWSRYYTDSSITSCKMANVFTAKSLESLTAAAFYTAESDVSYTVDVYTSVGNSNPESGTRITSASTSGVLANEGYHTVPLRSAVPLAERMRFSVVVTLSKSSGGVTLVLEGDPQSAGIEYSSKPGESFFSYGGDWRDSSINGDNNVCVKALTKKYDPVKVTGVYIDKTSLNITKNESVALNASTLPLNASSRELVWFSSNSAVALVSVGGVVTGLENGTAVITVKSKDGGFAQTCSVTVIYNPTASVSLSASSYYMNYLETASLVATVQPYAATNKKVVWSSDNENAVKVGDDGVIQAVGRGKATIKVTTVDGGFTAQCTVEVSYAWWQWLIKIFLLGFLWY